MNCSPLVSVIIPAFRQPRYVSQAVASAGNQTVEDLEIIVVDDASGEEYTRQYEFPEGVRLIRQPERAGPSAARNAGIREARGRYIAFLDQDDVWRPGKIEAQVALLEEDPKVGLTYCDVLYVDDDLQPTEEQGEFRSVTGEDLGRVLSDWFIKSCSVVCARREVFEQVGGMDEDLWIVGDWDLWTRVCLEFPIRPDPERRVLYRTHPDQLTGHSIRGWRESTAFQERWFRWAKRERPDLTQSIARNLTRELRHYADDLLWMEHRPAPAARTLLRSMRVNPRDVRNYTRLLTLAAAPLSPRYYRRQKP